MLVGAISNGPSDIMKCVVDGNRYVNFIQTFYEILKLNHYKYLSILMILDKLWNVDKYKLPEQGAILQSMLCLEGPSQGFPPKAG